MLLPACTWPWLGAYSGEGGGVNKVLLADRSCCCCCTASWHFCWYCCCICRKGLLVANGWNMLAVLYAVCGCQMTARCGIGVGPGTPPEKRRCCNVCLAAAKAFTDAMAELLLLLLLLLALPMKLMPLSVRIGGTAPPPTPPLPKPLPMPNNGVGLRITKIKMIQ